MVVVVCCLHACPSFIHTRNLQPAVPLSVSCAVGSWMFSDNKLDGAGEIEAMASSLAKLTKLETLNMECEWRVLAVQYRRGCNVYEHHVMH